MVTVLALLVKLDLRVEVMVMVRKIMIAAVQTFTGKYQRKLLQD